MSDSLRPHESQHARPPCPPPTPRVYPNSCPSSRCWSFSSFSFSISPSNEYSGVISFRIDWLDLLAVHGTLGSPWDCREIQQVHSKGDQSWVFIGRTDAEAATPVLQYFGHLMRRVDSWEKILILGGIGGRRRRG